MLFVLKFHERSRELQEPTSKKKKKKKGSSYDEWQSRRLGLDDRCFTFFLVTDVIVLSHRASFVLPCSSWYAEGGDSWHALWETDPHFVRSVSRCQ